MKGSGDDKDYPDFEEEKLEVDPLEDDSLEAEIEDDIFNGSFEFEESAEDNIPLLEDKVESVESNDDFDFEVVSETDNSNEKQEDSFNFEETSEFTNVEPEILDIDDSNKESVSLDDFDFESELKEIDEEPVEIDDFNFNEVDDKPIDTVDFDFNEDKIEDLTIDNLDDENIGLDGQDEIVANSNDDFEFEEFEEISNSTNDIVESEDEIIVENTDFDFDELTSEVEDSEIEVASSDDFNLTNEREESNLNNNNYEDSREEVMSNKKDDFDSDLDNDDFDFNTNDNDSDDFKFEEDTKSDDFEYDFGGQSKGGDDDFEVEEVSSTSNDNFETTYDFESDDKNDNVQLNDLEDEEDADHTPRVLKNDDSDADDIENSDAPKNNASKLKIVIGIVLVAILSVGGLLGWNMINKQLGTDPEEDTVETQTEEVVVKKEKPVKKEVKKSTSNDLSGLDDLVEPTPVKEERPSRNTRPAEQNIPNDTVSKEQYNQLNNQFEKVIGNLSNLSSEISSVKEENRRLTRLYEEVKKSNQGGANLENFQLDFSNVKSEINTLKKQVSNDKAFNKETMVKFLQISKKLREEITTLKTQQVDKTVLDSKMAEIEKLSKDIESLNSKVANNEVLTKIATLEKDINANKLAEVEKQVTKNNKQIENTVNKKKSVLELLEEKNKEKSLESNTVIVEEDEELRVPLSVTIEDESEYEAPVVRKQVVQKKTKHVYKFIGTIEGIVYLKNSSGTISEYRVNDQLPGYGEILKIYKDGTIETEEGPLNFK